MISSTLTVIPVAPAAEAAVIVRDYGVSANVGAYAHDPDDRLRQAGDTHELGLYVTRDDRGDDGYGPDATRIEMSVQSYTCGSRRPSDPPAGCEPAGQSSAVLADPRIDLLPGGAVRIRGAGALGRLDVTMTGSDPHPWVGREWRYAEGTRVEVGRSRSIEYASGVAVAGTLGAVTLTQLPEQRATAHLNTWTDTARISRGPRVPLPELPAHGPDGSGHTLESASADWRRPLSSTGPEGTRDLELGQARLSRFGGVSAEVHVLHERCAPGQRPLRPAEPPTYLSCPVTASFVEGDPDGTASVDRAAGTARMTALLQRGAGEPPAEVVVTWHGREPVGYLYQDVFHVAGVPTARIRYRSGIRWPHVSATGTIDGASLGRMDRVSFTVYREWYP